jgi:hypothetical protein
MRTNGNQPPATDVDAQLPSSEVRGIVGLFIFIHLFAVAVALTSYVFPSALQLRLLEVLGPYSGTLNFDLAPNTYPTSRFYLTYADTFSEVGDADFGVQIETSLPDGTVEKTTVPMPGLWPGERRRYQALANAAGAMASSEDVEPVLLRSIAGSVLKRSGANRGLVRVVAHKPLPRAAFESSDSSARNPLDARYYATVYEAHVLISPTGKVDLVKKAAAGEVAPVEKGS